jgi:hypothetical protein
VLYACQVVFTLAHLEVVPAVCASPLRAFILGWDASGTFQFHKVAEATSVVEFQAGRAFSGVRESAMEALVTEMGLDATFAGMLSETRRRDVLALTLMSHILPDLDLTWLAFCGACHLVPLSMSTPPGCSYGAPL